MTLLKHYVELDSTYIIIHPPISARISTVLKIRYKKSRF